MGQLHRRSHAGDIPEQDIPPSLRVSFDLTPTPLRLRRDGAPT